MTDAILVLNAGSSSIKFSMFDADFMADAAFCPATGLLCKGELSSIGHEARFRATDAAGVTLIDQRLPSESHHGNALDLLLEWIDAHDADREIIAAGHRVVHGGAQYTAPVLVDADVLDALSRLIALAPLHQPHHIAAIRALQTRYPALPQVACFDTAFHHTQPMVAATYALPRALTEEGIRRYGFHGLSYEYISSVLPQLTGLAHAGGRVVVAHLGAGASMCALQNGRSVATTMGFTALDGLPMSRRCGTLDPGAVLYLLQEKGLSADAVAHLLYHDSGLLGVSGISDDMQVLLESDDPHAAEAVDLFVYRIGRELGSLAAALGGMDALVFTGGIGEHAMEVRRRVGLGAGWLGVEIDPQANAQNALLLSPPGNSVSAWAIPTDEEWVIAQHTQRVLMRQQRTEPLQRFLSRPTTPSQIRSPS